MSRHGYHGHGAYGQQCVVLPSHDLVVAVTAQGDSQQVFDALWECLLPGLDRPDAAQHDERLAARLRRLALPPVPGTADPGRSAEARLDASPGDSALPDGTPVTVEPTTGGWQVRLAPALTLDVGHAHWRESSPLGRPVLASGAWQAGTFNADLCLVTTPHHVRLTVTATTATATATWTTTPLTGPDLELHLRSPLMTRPDVG